MFGMTQEGAERMNDRIMENFEKDRLAKGLAAAAPVITKKLLVEMYKKAKTEVRKEVSQTERQRQMEITERNRTSKGRIDPASKLALQASPRRQPMLNISQRKTSSRPSPEDARKAQDS